MRRIVTGLAAAGVLFAAGFALAQGALTVSIDTASIGSTNASFAYSANETVFFVCSLTVPLEPCGSGATAGSATYPLGPGTYTFAVEARYVNPTGLSAVTTTATASTVFTIAPTDTTASTATVTTTVLSTTTAAGVTVTTTEGGGSSPVAWAIAGGGFLAVLAATASWLTVRWRRRSGWQAKATTEEPPPHCVPPRRWCTTELTVKPGRRDIAYLSLAGQGPAARDLSERSESKAAEALNNAVDAYRRGGSADEVRLGVMPAGAELLDELRVQVVERTEGTEGVVAISAHLDGGKASCKFTVYRCVGTPPTTEWKEHDSWEVEVDDERDEPVAQVKLPLDDRSLELLVAQLAGFVTKVDVPERS
jgi:hypothetical protein